MNLRVTLALAGLLLISQFGLDPQLLPLPLGERGLGSAWHVQHWHFLILVELMIFLLALPLETRLGPLVLLASWGVPCLLQTMLWGRAWPELAAISLFATIVTVTWLRAEARPWKLWAPLGLATLSMLFMLRAPWAAALASLGVGAGVARWNRSEPVAVLGLASGLGLLLAWLS